MATYNTGTQDAHMMVKPWMNIVQQSDCVTLAHIKENFTLLINELEEIIWGYFDSTTVLSK